MSVSYNHILGRVCHIISTKASSRKFPRLPCSQRHEDARTERRMWMDVVDFFKGPVQHELRQLRSRFLKISSTETGIESGFRLAAS